MKVENKESSIEIKGNTSRNKVSIDINNINFITTLLSSNLYSQPINSFLRETVSNAWDSHVEAHKENRAVLINIKNTIVSIRDYGVGLSPERFKEIYLNIGSSTKREDNTQLGGFGIGRFSALSCSNVVTIKSFYNGTLYTYLMIKDGNSVNIDLVNTLPTTEENGVEVCVTVSEDDRYKIADGLKYLVFFPNIYVKGDSNQETFNDYKIKHYKTFAVSSIGTPFAVLLGNVLYPLDPKPFNSDEKDLYNILTNSNSALKFDIGELEITPNRESIIYSPKTIKVIKDRFNEYRNELVELLRKEFDKPCDNILDITEKLNYTDFKVDLLEVNYLKIHAHIPISFINVNFKNKGQSIFQYKGEYIDNKLSDIINTWDRIKGLIKPNLIAIVNGDTFYKDAARIRSHWGIFPIKYYSNIIIPEGTILGKYIRKYILEKSPKDRWGYTESSICNPYTENDLYIKFYNELNKGFSIPKNLIDKYSKEFARCFYEKLIKNSISLDFNSKEFLDFKEALKTEEKSLLNNNVIKNIKVNYILKGKDEGYYYYKEREFLTSNDYISWANGLIGGTIIINKRNENKEVFLSLAKIKKCNIILVNKDVLKYNNRIKSYIPEDNLIDINKGLMNILCTIVNEEVKFPAHYSTLIDILPKEDLKCIMYLRKYLFVEDPIKAYLLNRKPLKKDKYTLHCIEVSNKYFNFIEEIENQTREVNLNQCVMNNTANLAFIVMKKKMFRISGAAYRCIKQKALYK